MMALLISLLLWFIGIYFGIGILFGIAFLFLAPKIDPVIGESKWVLRLLFFPGAIAMWIFLLPKLFRKP